MSTYGEQKKAWASEWAKIRKDYLSGKLLDVIALTVGGGRLFGGSVLSVVKRGPLWPRRNWLSQLVVGTRTSMSVPRISMSSKI